MRATLAKVRTPGDQGLRAVPALSGPSWRSTLPPTLTANLVRNVWSHSVIMCGHFPEGVETFEQEPIDADETRGEWYLRQMLGSANISGPPLLHLLTGNLSPPDRAPPLPGPAQQPVRRDRSAVRAVFERYGLRYHAAPPRQVASAWHKVLRLSLPNGWLQRHRPRGGRRGSLLAA